jgi:metal-responsive CopG/Arc/MetJ family transcriptional regulator
MEDKKIVIPKKEKFKTIALRLPESLLKELDEIALEEKCKRSHLIRFFLTHCVRKFTIQNFSSKFNK